jgi:site-specific DNA-methyltransferase (adenine-specific)
VKPIELMRWLVRLTPPGGVVLDPFTGSGTTGVAAVAEGRTFLGLEREVAYVDIACARLTHWAAIAAQEEVLP